MKDISPVKKLTVYCRLSQGDEILLGQLAQNKQGVFFQYDSDYLTRFHSISPFSLDFSNKLNSAPRQPHQGLQGRAIGLKCHQ